MSLRYPSDGFSGDADYVAFNPTKYNGRGNGGTSGGGYIMLYMPETTPTISNPNQWGRESMGGAGPIGLAKRAVAEDILGSAAGIDFTKPMSESQKEQTMDDLKGAISGIKGNTQGIVKQGILNAASGFLATSPNAVMQQKQGQIYNPNVELIYQGPSFRSFGFSFNMIPKSSGDSQTINQIIREFKRFAAPEDAGGGMYEIPFVWNVSYMGRASGFMNRFKPAALMNISVTDNDGYNYYASHEDGAPIQTTLTLEFKEVDMIMRNDHSGPRGF